MLLTITNQNKYLYQFNETQLHDINIVSIPLHMPDRSVGVGIRVQISMHLSVYSAKRFLVSTFAKLQLRIPIFKSDVYIETSPVNTLPVRWN